MKKIILLFTLLLSSSWANEENLVKMSLATLIKGESTYLAVTFLNKEKWHTYWKNPGSAGKEIEVHFEGIEATELEWPAPKLYREAGGLIAYGYSNEYTFFYKIANNLNADFKVKANWLICKDICIPGKKDLSGKLNNGILITKNEFKTSPKLLEERFAQLPIKAAWLENLKINLHKGKKANTLDLFYSTKRPFPKTKDTNFLTPFPTFLITFNKEVVQKEDSILKGHLPLEWDGEYEDPEIPLPEDGKLNSPLTFKFVYHDSIKKRPVIIEKSFSSFQLDQPAQLIAATTEAKKMPPATSRSILIYIVLAFFGGLILNVMPCVLPVISLKLFSLAAHSDESDQSIFRHNLFYTFGVLATFFALAIIVLVMKASGESIGWGFQLQSPLFVSIMAILLFILGLNLFGLFEFKTPGGKTLGNMELKKGVLGDFMGGVLATILSTPCSAPLLGGALTFAFTAGTFEIFTIFTFIGLGLSSPFILTGLFPSLIKFLPKPGMWMENVKKFLGMTMFLTVLWLLDVFNSLTDLPLAYTKINVVMLFVFFAFYFDKKIGKKKPLKIIFYILPLVLFNNLIITEINTSHASSKSMIAEKKRDGLQWEPWSEKRMEELKGELVFIDFTAKWCLTCKVNEKLVIDTSAFKKLVDDYNVKLLLGDWTKRDPIIEAFLKKNGHVGVPVYFIQKKSGELIDLGETISIKEIESHLK